MTPDIIPDELDSPETRLSALSDAMRMLKLFSEDHYELGLGELSVRLDLPKCTVHRLARTLIETGMLIQNAESRKYRPGLVVFELAAMMQRKMHVTGSAPEDITVPRLSYHRGLRRSD
ncbi:MAG TPA: helix-turn-helix domain-containing protein [Herbaspirillum sp.]|jgi:IclR family KDG regulon transcriptional repressor